MDDSLRLQFGMAEVHFEQKRYREAAAILEVVVSEAPSNASPEPSSLAPTSTPRCSAGRRSRLAS